MSIKAVVFDLDDTLYSEYDYVLSGFNAVAAFVDIPSAADEFKTLFDASRNNVFDRFAQAHRLPSDVVAEMVDVYRRHEPKISLSAEVENTLVELRKNGYKLGIITDGRPEGQRAKIKALGLDGLVDKIIVTDELGGVEFRKPAPVAFTKMAEELGVGVEEMLYVGDNPQKDFAVKRFLPIKTARVYGGGVYAYADYADGLKEDIVLGSVAELSDCDFDKQAFGGQAVIRELLLGIMDYIHDVCDKEKITYSLSGGTLIGAVRHNGFVPWDDDIDVVMKRDEYDKFISAVKAHSNGFEVDESLSRVPQVRYATDPIASGKRYHGIKIDIFILDNFPDGEKERNKIVFKLKTLQGMMRKDRVTWSNYSVKGKLLLMGTKFLGAFRSMKGLIASYKKISTAYNSRPTESKFISNDLFAVMDIAYKNEWFERTVDVPFEDRTYKIFDAYDSILKLRYGDYMRLPPKSKREPWHEITIAELN